MRTVFLSDFPRDSIKVGDVLTVRLESGKWAGYVNGRLVALRINEEGSFVFPTPVHA